MRFATVNRRNVRCLQLITIHSYDNQFEAEHDRALLESSGVPVELSGMFYRKIGPIELRVRPQDIERAAELLHSIGRTVLL